jgi:hypothetical protein
VPRPSFAYVAILLAGHATAVRFKSFSDVAALDRAFVVLLRAACARRTRRAVRVRRTCARDVAAVIASEEATR